MSLNLQKSMLFVVCVFCFSVSGGRDIIAESDYVPTTCVGMDKEFTPICEVAKKYKTPLYATASWFFFSGLESASRVCSFSVNERFNLAKAQLLKSSNAKKVYDLFIKNFDESKIPNKESWCQEHYLMFGPNAPKGPNGGDNQLYR